MFKFSKKIKLNKPDYRHKLMFDANAQDRTSTHQNKTNNPNIYWFIRLTVCPLGLLSCGVYSAGLTKQAY